MIISHKHKFIFIKTEKTAGTSIEIALSKYCGPKDIITPLTDEDEKLRSQLGYRGPQNYQIPVKYYNKKELLSVIYNFKPIFFQNHDSASYIKRHTSQFQWNTYYKFCFERNPWDKVISWYYWRYKVEPRPTLFEFIESGEACLVKGFELYTEKSKIVVDKVFFYEDLKNSLVQLSEKLNLKEALILPLAKGQYRKDKRNYKCILNKVESDHISILFAREIAHFNYNY